MIPRTYTYWIVAEDHNPTHTRAGAHVIESTLTGEEAKTYRLVYTTILPDILCHRELCHAQDVAFEEKLAAVRQGVEVSPGSQESIARASILDRRSTALILFDHHDLDPFQAFDLMAAGVFRHGLGSFLETLKAVRS